MNNKNTAIIITVVVVLVCACLPLCAGIVGAVNWMGGDWFGLNDGQTYLPIGGFCAGMLGIIIAALVGFFTLRKKPEETPSTDEPLPPAY
jgi:hypothetical protein